MEVRFSVLGGSELQQSTEPVADPEGGSHPGRDPPPPLALRKFFFLGEPVISYDRA